MSGADGWKGALRFAGGMSVVKVEPGHQVVCPQTGRVETVTETSFVYGRDTIYVTSALFERLRKRVPPRRDAGDGP